MFFRDIDARLQIVISSDQINCHSRSRSIASTIYITLYNSCMPKSVRTRKAALPQIDTSASMNAMPQIPLAAVFSFLKDMRGALTWTAQDLIGTLKVSREDAEKILLLLQMQGYVQKTEDGEWLTTAAGEIVSGSKLPRFGGERIEQALATISERIAAINRDTRAEFRITKAVAFGDFLSDRPTCQAADIGIELSRRNRTADRDATKERHFLKQLGRKSRFLQIRPYERWMSERTHRRLAPVR